MTEPKNFRTRPTSVMALQWTTEDEAATLVEWVESHGGKMYRENDVCGVPGPGGEDWGDFQIDTAAGILDIAPLDYLILGPHGFEPCKPDAFNAMYEELPR